MVEHDILNVSKVHKEAFPRKNLNIQSEVIIPNLFSAAILFV